MTWRTAATALVCAVLAGTLLAQRTAPPPARVAGWPQVWWGHAGAADLALITSHQRDVNHLLDIYNYGYEHWDLHKLLCDCLRRENVYEGLFINDYGQVSEFVMIIADGPKGHELSLIPVAYEGDGYAGTPADLHNVAIFNRIVQAEQPRPQTVRDWMTWALVYLELCGEQPQIIDELTRAAVAQPRLAKMADWPAAPEAHPTANGGTELEFVNFNVESQLVQWTMDFDRDARLRHLVITPLTKPKPPEQ